MNTVQRCSEQIKNLIVLLESETAMLRNGELSGLQDHSALKLEAIKQLEASLQAISSDEEKAAIGPLMIRLDKLSNENGILLKSMFNGSRAAQAKLARLQQQEVSVGVYGRNGQAVCLEENPLLSGKTV
ncbi:hypothetical protein [Parvularcula sp. IMCC14364]|uniref:hypothetical protein n=1 Tax=Parvularcula sp. IMCC14364 TaxID=3067902 RepID=UPI002740BBBE|nr:hypothetical protein [Parvularcula sp. IMCC14364]